MTRRTDRVQLNSASDAAALAALINQHAVDIRAAWLVGENAVALTQACDWETLRRLAAEAGIRLEG